MPVARGTIHRSLATAAGTQALLVLTNDVWNSTMSGIGVLPLRGDVPAAEAPHAVAIDELYALASRPTQVGPADDVLGPAIAVADDGQLSSVEDALLAFLQISEILGPMPAPRRPPPGRITYPLWGEIYYLDPPIQGQRKRFVTVSPNPWNAVSGLAGVVRLTTAIKYDRTFFPTVLGGRAQACPGELATVRSTRLRIRGDQRPTPSILPLADMAAVLRAIVQTWGLEEALRRAS